MGSFIETIHEIAINYQSQSKSQLILLGTFFQEFVAKFEGITVTITPIKNVFQIAFKIFATKWFFTDHLKHKTINKTTYKMASANCKQVSWKAFPLLIF